MDPAEVLARLDWLTDAPLDAIQQLADACTDRALTDGDVVYTSGDPAYDFFVLVEGRVGAGRPSWPGAEDDRGWYFITDAPATTLCLENVITQIPYFATMRALAAGTRVLTVPVTALDRLLERHPQTGIEMARHVARRLQAFTQEVVDASRLDNNRRVAKYLLRLTGSGEQGQLTTVPMTQQALAARLAMSRQSVNAAVARLVQHGWIEPAGQAQYLIRDREALRRFVGDRADPGVETFQ